MIKITFSSKDVMEHRQLLCEMYRQKLSEIDQIDQMPTAGLDDTPWVFGIECSSKLVKTHLRKRLAKYGIETRDFFFPIHLQPAFAGHDLQVDPQNRLRLKVAEEMSSRGLYLPMHTGMTAGDVEFVCRLIQNFFLPIELQETIPNKLEEKNFTVEVMRAGPGDLPKIESRTFDVTTGQLVTSNRSTYSLLVFKNKNFYLLL